MILVPEKELINKSEEFLRSLKDVLPPFLEEIHKKITLGNVIRPPLGLPYFLIYIPEGIQIDDIAIAEIEQAIINFGGKFTMHIPLEKADTIKVFIALKDVSEFRFKRTTNTYETITNTNTEIMKPSLKEFTRLKEQIKKFLKMLQLNEAHYSQIIPEADLTVEYGPVFFKEKAYADYVITQVEKYKKLDGYVFARAGEIKNVYFKIGFTNPLTEEQPLPTELTPVATPTSVKAEAPASSTAQTTSPLSDEKVEAKKAENQLEEVKLFLQHCGIRSGKYYNNIVLNNSQKFAVLNSVVEEKRQEIIEAFTKNGLFNCLELKEGNKSIRVDLALFKNPFSAPDKNDVKAPAKSIAKKSPVAKESPKINSVKKLADLRAFIHTVGIICGQHYAAITLNAAKTIASINGVPADGPLRVELIDKFKAHGLLNCLDTTSTEKSVKVDLALFEKPVAVKAEPVKSSAKKATKVKEDKILPKNNEVVLSFDAPLSELKGLVGKLDLMTKAMQFDPATIWDSIKSNFSKDTDFELLIRTKSDAGEISKVIQKDEFLKIFIK